MKAIFCCLDDNINDRHIWLLSLLELVHGSITVILSVTLSHAFYAYFRHSRLFTNILTMTGIFTQFCVFFPPVKAI
ncbi:hypothetical protein PO909_029766 [Leuciscus waleckii]